MNVIRQEVRFGYREKLDQATGMKTRRIPDLLTIDFPILADLVLNASEKVQNLLQDAVNQVLVERARELLASYDAKTFPYVELDFEKIANLPPAQRKGGGIAQETWDAFIEDYKTIIVAVTGKTQDQVDNAAKILSKRLVGYKTSKDHLIFFAQMLALYQANSPNAAEYSDVVEFLTSKIEEGLNTTPEQALANL